jgi:hypothetical protein
MDAAKIRLSAEELVLVQNAHWLLTKNNIIEKVVAAFGRLSEQMKAGTARLRHPCPQKWEALPLKYRKEKNTKDCPG